MVKKSKIAYDSLGGAGAIVLGYVGRSQVDLGKIEEDVMGIILSELQDAGAANIQQQGNKITEFIFETDDFNGDYSQLNNPMDFSEIPEKYMEAAGNAFYIGLGTGIGGLVLRGIGHATKNEHINGLGKITTRAGAAYGLGKILEVKKGLENIPHELESSQIFGGSYGVQEFSAFTRYSSGDITEQVAGYIKTLNGQIAGLGVILAIDGALTVWEYVTDRPASKATNDYSKKDLGVETKPTF